MFCWTTIHVSNLEESIRFYRDIVGLKVTTRYQANEQIEIAFLGEGETLLELLYDASAGKSHVGDSISLGFKTDSLEKTIKFLAEHHIPLQSNPVWPNEHLGFFYVYDPDGVRVQFVENR